MEPLRQTPRGHYKILEKIGEGSLGVVYLAEDTETKRRYALKTLRDRGSVSGADLERVRGLFMNEADAGSVLSHPGVTKIHDVVEDPLSGELYLVLEYVSGSSLAERLARPDPLPFDFVSKVICQVADVLDYVHARGIVHRDIKPANILIDEEGTIKITDFGISDLQREDLALELQRAGSPNYMAPERVLGTGADHRADIWALGVVLYEMTTRNLPFRGESVGELIQNVAAEEPPPLSAYNPFSIPGLQPIVDRVLSKEPEDRYQQAGDLAEELRLVQLSQLSLSATLPATAIPELGAPDREALSLEEIFASDPEAAPEQAPPEPEPEEASDGPAWGTAWKLPSWRPGRRAVAAAAVGFATLLLMFLAAAPGPEAPAPSEPAPAASPQVEETGASSEYLALLEDARRLYAKGQEAEASTLLARAAAMSPAGSRIHEMREDARKQAAEEVAAEVDRDVAAWIGIAQADLDEGRFQNAREAAERALDLDSEHAAAHALVAEIEDQRRVEERRQDQRREAPKPTFVIERLPPPAPKPIQIAAPVPLPPPVAVPQFADLKVDFHSELPRGVVTVYLGESQVIRHPFRFVEKRGFIRSRGTSGGFDEQIRVDAGPASFRVYLSLPGRETQVQRLSGLLPAGEIRALRVRVDKDGSMTVSLV